MTEEWVKIEEFPMYSIKRNGDVRNDKTGVVKHPCFGLRGYPVVSLVKDGKSYLRTIHILLARTFIPNPENKPQVNHIDGDKLNFSLENLEWVTAKENNQHARRTGLHKTDGDKPIKQIDCFGNIVCIYKSASEASRKTGINLGNICGVARGNTRAKTAGGYKWEYVV